MKKLSIVLLTMTLVVLLAAGCTMAKPEVSSPAAKPAPTTSEPAKPPPTSPSSLPKPAPAVNPAPGMGVVNVYVTDPPPPEMDEIWVDIKTLEAHRTGGNWTILAENPGEFDLKELENPENEAPIKQFLASQVVEIGKYTQLRFEVNSVRIVVDTDNYSAEVPSDKIKLVGVFEVTGDNPTDITLDFNGEKSVLATGKGNYIFKPVIKLLVEGGKPPEIPPTDADLEISKSDSPDPVRISDNLTYTLTVTNKGPADATGVNVTDTLPPEVTFQSATPSTGSANETAPGIVTWNIGNLAKDASVNLTILVTTPATSDNITNSATVSAAQNDPVPANNTDSETTEVKEILSTDADLEISKSDSPDPVSTSDNLTYTVIVTNEGPADATGVNVTDTLPAGVAFQSATPSTGSANETAPGIVTWNIGNLLSGASANLTILVTTPATSDNITNSVVVFAIQNDPVPANNTDSETTEVK